MITRLAVDTSAPTIKLVSTLDLRFPRTWSELGELQEAAVGSEQQRRALRRLLTHLGVFSDAVSDEILRQMRAQRPDASAPLATVRLRGEAPQYGYYQQFVAPWTVEPAARNLRFSVTSEPRRGAARWSVSVELAPKLTVASSSRGAFDQDQTTYWNVAPTEPTTLTLVADLPRELERQLEPGRLRAFASYLSQYIALVVMLAVAFVAGRRAQSVGAAGADEASRVRSVAVAGLVVTAAVVLVDAGRRWAWDLVRWQWPEWVAYTDASVVGGQIALAAIALVAVVPQGRRFRPGLATLAAVLLLAPLVVERLPTDDPAGTRFDDRLLWATAVPGSVLVAGLLIWTAAVTTITLGRPAAAERLPEWGDSLLTRIAATARHRLVLWALVVGLAAALFAAWFLWMLDNVWGAYDVKPPGPAVQLAPYFPVDLLYLVPRVLEIVILVALVAMLASAGRSARSAVIGSGRRAVRLILSLLFAWWVVGYGGTAWGFAVPIAFLVGFGLMYLLLGDRFERRVDRIAVLNELRDAPPETLTTEKQVEYLTRARALELVRRKKRTLYAEFRDEKLDDATYDAKYKALEAEAEYLRTGDVNKLLLPQPPPPPTRQGLRARVFRGAASPPPPTRTPAATGVEATVLLPPRCTPYSLALSLGPYGSWWGNGKVGAAIGAAAGFVPLVVYFRTASIPDAPLGLIYAMLGVLSEYLRWPVLGLVLGCAYAYLPGHLGVLKAGIVVLAAACAVVAQTTFESSSTFADSAARLAFLGLVALTVAIVLDAKTVQRHQFDLHHLTDLYQLYVVRRALALAPVVATAVGLAVQLLSGNWSVTTDFFGKLAEIFGG